MIRAFLIGGISVLVLAAIGVGAYFLIMPAAAAVEMEFAVPDEIYAGQPFNLGVSVSNYSDKILENGKIALMLPDGVSVVGKSMDQRVAEQLLGDLGPGSLNQQTFRLIVVDTPQSVKRLKAKVTYRLGGSSGQFEELAETDLTVGRSSIDLVLTLPEKVPSGEDFEIGVEYRNLSGQDLKDLFLKLDYPPVFQFKGANEEPDRANNFWNLGPLKAGEKKAIISSGNLVGPPQSRFSFQATLGMELQGQKYNLNVQTVEVAMAASPLQIGITVNGNTDHRAELGERLRYSFRYKNDSGTAMSYVTVRATLTGEMFDFAGLRGNGTWSSLSNTMTWDAANRGELASLGPGAEGELTLEIPVKKSFPIQRMSDKNFTLKANARIESPTVPPGTAADKTISVARLETRVIGDLVVDAKALFRDAASGILNSGPYPPRVNSPTQYTVHWTVKNYANDIAEARVSALLRSGARFTGAVKSNTVTKPTLNSASGEVYWELPSIPAGRGVINTPMEAVFQVEYTPSSREAGDTRAVFLGETRIQGKDTFTETVLRDTAEELGTDLPFDPQAASGKRDIQP